MAVVSKPSQDFVPIKEVRDGVAILRDGTLLMILMASTLNFSLKSEEEQTAIIMQYQNFLNSLDFPIQFFIESRKLNINSYLSLIYEAEKEQPNELLKIQTREYMEFVKNLVKAANIVQKTFYVVVSYKGSSFSQKGGFLDQFGGIFSKKQAAKNEIENGFEDAKVQLQQRSNVVAEGLVRAGVRAVNLNTEELIELFYKLFNPGELEKEIKE